MSDRKYRNLLAEMGCDKALVQQRLEEWFEELFTPGTLQCIFGEDETGAYLIDTGNNDVRTEGQSYGMMMAVQRNRQDIFDAIWAWTKRYMWHKDGKYAGYFAWSCNLDGTRRAQGPAPDGEEYFAMALFFASHRWGDREYPFDYSVQARDILRHCVHQHELTNGEGEPMWDPETFQIRFIPETRWTDPSYHLPHFYELFALWADEEDRPFWKKAAEESRKFIARAADPVTGLFPEYSHYDGSLITDWRYRGDTFYSDAYRVLLNIALDTQWFGPREEYREIADRQQKFFAEIGFDPSRFMEYHMDGTPGERKALHPVGLTATLAAGSLAAENHTARDWVRLFWNTPLRTDARRYFDSDLCYFALMMLSGEYKIF